MLLPGLRCLKHSLFTYAPVHERSMGLRRGAAWGCASALHVAAQGRSTGLRMGAAWGCAWAQHGAAQGRSVGLRGAQHGAAQGRSVKLCRGAAWGMRFSGSMPGMGEPRAADPYSPPAPIPATGRDAVVGASAHGPPAPRVAAATSCGTVGGGGTGSGGPSGRRPDSAVSGQWSGGQQDPLAARVRVPRAGGARPPLARQWPLQSPGPGVAPVLLLRRRLSFLSKPRVLSVRGPGPLLAGRRAIAVGLGRHLRLCLRGGWGCGGG